MSTPHPPEEAIAAHVAGLAAPPDLGAHLEQCERCAALAQAYEGLVAGLRALAVPVGALEAARGRLTQVVRLRAFVDRLLTEPAWQAEVRQNPEAALRRHGIDPTPELVAALRDPDGLARQGPGLDERISKLLYGL